jgi:hypothetical protein
MKAIDGESHQSADEGLGKDGMGAGDISSSAASGATVPWDVSMLSSQVRLVELLQLTGDLTAGLRKIGIVVSAWDRVAQLGHSPIEWLRNRLPLVSQYIDSCKGEIDTAVFGVSAYGGDPETERDVLARNLSPADRIKVVGIRSDQDVRDITLPVRWLLS